MFSKLSWFLLFVILFLISGLAVVKIAAAEDTGVYQDSESPVLVLNPHGEVIDSLYRDPQKPRIMTSSNSRPVVEVLAGVESFSIELSQKALAQGNVRWILTVVDLKGTTHHFNIKARYTDLATDGSPDLIYGGLFIDTAKAQ